MNERILELARQAGLKKPHASDTEYIGNFDWREFAELLIRECALQCVHNEDMDLIEKHFGVDE